MKNTEEKLTLKERRLQSCLEWDREKGLQHVDYLAGAIERLGGAEKAAKRLKKTPEALRGWLKTGVGRVIASFVMELVSASGVPSSALRMGPFVGRPMSREDLLAATQRMIDTWAQRDALREVECGLKSMLALDRRTHARIKAFLRNAEMEVKALQKELNRYQSSAKKAAA